jgi:hypothetical protein
VVAIVIAGATAGAILAAAGAKETQQTRDYADRVEQLAFRAGVVKTDMTERAQGAAGSVAALEGDLAAMAQSLSETARGLSAMMTTSQELLENNEAESDAEILQDVTGVRTQLDSAARDLENVMQYLEHLTYKVHKLSS